MPTLEDLDTLKTQINSLGDEIRLLTERGETLHDVAPPVAPADDDLERLLNDDKVPSPDDGVNEMEALLGNYVADEVGSGEEVSGEVPDDIELPGESFADTDDFNLDDLIESVADDLPESSETPESPIGEFNSDSPTIDNLDNLDEIESLEDLADITEPVDEVEELLTLDDLDDLTGSDSPEVPDLSDIPEISDIPDISDISGDSEAFSDGSFSLDDLDDLDDLDFGDAIDIAESEVPDEPETIDTLDTLEDFGEIDSGDEFSPDGLEEIEDVETAVSDDIDSEDSGFNLDDLESAEDTSAESPDDSVDDGVEDLSEVTSDLEDLGSLEFTDDGFSDDDLSLDDLNFDDTSGGFELDEAGGLEDLGGTDDIPDIDSAVESLGDVDTMDEGGVGELSLNDDLNFGEELGADVFSDIQEAGDDSQQFSMDDFGEQYNFKEGETGFTENLGVDLEKLEQSLDDATEDEPKPFSLEEEDYTDIIASLASLPRNLKMAIEELLADDRRSAEDLKPIIDGLIGGDTPKVLAVKFQALTKRKIELPRSYEKRSGHDLEARRASLTYSLLREGWPVVRTVLLVIAVAWTFGAAVFMWVYRPIKAGSLYDEGLEAIATDEVDTAVERFHDAWDGWPLFSAPEGGDRIGDSPVIVKGWEDRSQWLDYARALRRRKHWDAADSFYSGYLYENPGAREVRLEYAEFLSSVLGRYESAVQLLDSAPTSGRGTDRDYMLAAGDVYLRWAEDDPTMYDQARYRYAKVLETSRNDERSILSMMRYHLRIDDDEEIKTLLPIFKDEIPGKTGEPVLAAEVFAGLGAWHLNHQDEGNARKFLDLALGANPLAPEPHYVDARYWRNLGDSVKELDALKLTIVALEGRESMSRNELEMRILTLGGLGRLQHSLSSRLADSNPPAAVEARSLATTSYSKALNLYEDARDRNQLGASPQYGQLYLELGDVLFAGVSSTKDLKFTFAETNESISPDSDRYAELVQAESYYNEAETLFDRGDSGSRLPDESLYRRGYARYVLGKDGALVDFHRVARRRPSDYEAHLSLATILLKSGDFEASRSQYARSIELLDEELRRTGGRLNPLDRQGHAELLIRYIYAWNNLGVGRAGSAARGGGDDDYAAALTAFTVASEYYDQVYTDMPEVVERVSMLAMRDPDDVRLSSVGSDGRVDYKERGTYPYINRQMLLGLNQSDTPADAYLIFGDIPSDLTY